MIRFSTEQTLLIHSYLGTEGLRDEAALESALRAPFQTFGGEDLYPGKLRKAAALCFGLIQNHPFIDDPFAQRLHIFDGDCLVYQGGSSEFSPIQAAA